MKYLSLFFKDNQQRNLFLMLAVATAFDGLLVLGRMYFNWPNLPSIRSLDDLVSTRNVQGTYLFLLWNLFLAWIPYLAALRAERLARRRAHGVWVGGWLLLWLIFFPNAPYLVTDFIHLRHRLPVPVWYDLTLLFACASTGLLLGLLSLHEVQGVLRRRFSGFLTGALLFGAIGLGGFGVWLGRFQRWNSWDVATNPLSLFGDLTHTLSQRQGFVTALGMSVLLSGILLVGYGVLRVLMSGREDLGRNGD